MKLKLAAVLTFAAALTSANAQVLPYESHIDFGQPQPEKYDKALELYERGMYDRSILLFRELARETSDVNARGYYVLNAEHLRVPGYEKLVEEYIAMNPSSGLIAQIRYRYGLNLFDDKDFSGASAQFEILSRHSIYRSQMPEFLFKKAYCDFELRNLDRALLRFKDLAVRERSDYTAPAQYAAGYICYEQKNFSEAIDWLSASAEDGRFTSPASYYILESRFMLGEHDIVTSQGPGVLASVSEEKKPYVARFISESALVLGDKKMAKEYFELGRASLSSDSRTDFFYAGSVLYAVGDYQGAVDNFSRIEDRTDSIGQIANYNLAYSLIKVKNKVGAMEAFKEASAVSFNRDITEDALFNYAKLAFDLNSDSSVFKDYLEKYPETGKKEQIYSYMAIAALYEKDYEGAIEAYDKIDELDSGMKSNYMKANYLRAHQLISSGAYRNAVGCLKAAAYYSDRRTYFNQMTRYWLSEAYFRSSQFPEARSVLTDLYNTSALYGTDEYSLVIYNLAYCHFKEENYQEAVKWFETYLREDRQLCRKEAMLRLADSQFMLLNYKEAAASYDRMLESYFNVNEIYPYYQAAMAYGLAGDNARKVKLLSNVEKASPAAPYYPEAMFELGRSFVRSGEEDRAAECFLKLASAVKDSTYVARAYIELGLLYRNRSEDGKALVYYKKIAEEMPASEYADAALAAIESIYKSMNAPEEYLSYIESIGKSSIKTDEEKETMIFNAAEQIFLSENYQKALTSLGSYLAKYPSGTYVPNAEYYMAESYKNLDQLEKACDYYAKVIESGSGSIVEQSLLNYASLSYSMHDYEAAYEAYSKLLETAAISNNRRTASVGMMRSAFRAKMFDEAISAAATVTENGNVSEEILLEARYLQAKSYLATSRRSEAFAILSELAGDPVSPEGAEAAFLLIQDAYDRAAFDEVETKVYSFSDSNTGQTYWLAKAFVVLGDAFVEMGDIEQAKATYGSVADGYVPEKEDDDILESVRLRLEKLEKMQPAAAPTVE